MVVYAAHRKEKKKSHRSSKIYCVDAKQCQGISVLEVFNTTKRLLWQSPSFRLVMKMYLHQ